MTSKTKFTSVKVLIVYIVLHTLIHVFISCQVICDVIRKEEPGTHFLEQEKNMASDIGCVVSVLLLIDGTNVSQSSSN